jgi:membrane-associated phospholipid phosphatase
MNVGRKEGVPWAVVIAFCLVSSPAAADDGPTYALRLDRDLPVLGVAAAMAASSVVRAETPPPWCAPRCDPSRVNAFDRATAGVYRPSWSRASDVGVGALLAANVVTVALDEGFGNMLNDAVVIAQAILASQGLATLTSAAVRRPRPYAYGDDAPLGERTDPYAALSFFSGHTTTAFAAAVVLHRTLARRHPESSLPNIVLGSTLAVAAFVGAGRVLSGNHFPTDVLTGAVVGSSAGVLVPALHGSGLALTPLGSAEVAGMCVRGSF